VKNALAEPFRTKWLRRDQVTEELDVIGREQVAFTRSWEIALPLFS